MNILRNIFYYFVGFIFLVLAKAKNHLKGYTTPKPITTDKTDECVQYDIFVVEHWLAYLEKYTNGNYTLKEKNILELGPGSDLGVGVYLIAKGCLMYSALDKNNLIIDMPNTFYQTLIEKLRRKNEDLDLENVNLVLEEAKKGLTSKLNYVVRDDFNLILAFGENKFDLVFSQAAFEHYDDIEKTLSQLSVVSKPGAILITEIDLMTHSRWIREKDPNNIYRYSNKIYNIFNFNGIPNRCRPYQYKEVLERHGWDNIQIIPLQTFDCSVDQYFGINKKFRSKENQMDYLSIILCARKK